MKNVVFIILLLSNLPYSQTVDSVKYKVLKEEINSFHKHLPYYSISIRKFTSNDSAKIKATEIYYKTHTLLNSTLGAFMVENEPYQEYAKDRNLSESMKQVLPILSSNYYEPKAILKIRNNLKKLPPYYRDLYNLHKITYDFVNLDTKGKVVKKSGNIAELCDKLYKTLYIN
ncbi:hypothetical protein [Dyadobacter psychrotolerans]|uniref:Uncharacterized protein n=1 Tax=Dyadobacter psychrotolerans TaxID=2541721 RepID=A0A4R5DG23_9BACT|nr:hypothetical protein [Dyadobacter psychrotolerans]TDE12137.1 hypothetical protein E0F88_24135 [Dyadobacter psychrotolerans]